MTTNNTTTGGDRTQSDFINNSSINGDLINAVVDQMGGWESFIESAQDVANYGIDSGFTGFIYTRDTVEFFIKNRRAISQLAKDMADDFGQNVMDMVCGFNCIKDTSEEMKEAVAHCVYGVTLTDEDDTVANALAWFAGEEVCRSFSDWSDNE